jgi:hypothetical protein
LAKVFLFVAFVSFGAEAAPLSEIEESGAQRLTNRMERSMTRTRLRRYFRHGMLPQLIAFEACMRHGSVTRAAEELSLAQPTVSCLLRKLSEALGAPVTEMRERRMEPSALGKEILELCHEIFGSFERFDVRREGVAANQANAAATDGDGAGYDRPAPSQESPSWPFPLQQRSRSRSRPRTSRCPRAKPRPTETSGGS